MTPPLITKKISNPKSHMPPISWDWLSYKPSLTKRLREFTNNQITFHVIHEAWEPVDNKLTWVRKIQWRHQNNCWIEANLQLPKTSINSETACLLDTNERPIGEQLFKEPSLTRTNFMYFKPDKNTTTWIRESTFYFRKQPLKLTETFFPPFFDAIEQ